MARIPDEVLERIKRDVSVLRLAENMGCTFKKNGDDNYLGRCPWHDDKTPSLVISVKKNLYHCLGCGAKGSPIDWVMRQYGVSFRHAAELLQEGLPDGGAPAQPVRNSTVRHLPPPIDIEGDDRSVLLQIVDYYHAELKQSPEALAYLEARGFQSGEAIGHFKLGFANRTLGYRLPQKNRKVGDELRGRLQRLGILRESGHEHFTGSLIVPVFGEDGSVTEIYGRKVTRDSQLRKGTPLHLYLPGPHKGVWNLDAVKASKEVILCEALLDALTFWVHGYRNVTASYGVNGFTDDHLEAFQRHGVERVLIAYDRDDAGNNAAATLAEKLIAEGFECYRVELPKGMDVNEYALKVTPAAKSLDLVLRKASWLGKGRPPATKPVVSHVAAVADLSLISLAAKEAAPLAAEEGAHEPGSEGILPSSGTSRAGRPRSQDLDMLIAAKEESTTAHEPESPANATPPAQGDPRSLAATCTVSSAVVLPGTVSSATTLPGTVSSAAGCSAVSFLAAAFGEPVASPEPTATPLDVLVDVAGDDVVLVLGSRRYRVRGLPEQPSYEQMKVNLHVAHLDVITGGPDLDRGSFVDRVDLYAFPRRSSFAKQAAIELGLSDSVIHRDLGKVLQKLEELQHERSQRVQEESGVEIIDGERAEALALLRDPQLLDRIVTDFDRCGVVGEQTNKLLGYLAAVSRKLEEPLAVIIQSSSAAGKSSLMEAILAMVPEEERIQYSAMTGQSLYYMTDTKLKHKVLAIAEEEGAERASYALKLLQSEGELTIASTGKDPDTGQLVTEDRHVEGPVMLLLTTTAIEVDEELMNRCLVLTVNEEREQTRAIHQLQRQRQTLAGLLARRDAEDVRTLHRNAQRLLRPLLVANPYAPELTFLDNRTRTRRDHMKYLTLIRTIALLHQYQRPVKEVEHHGKPVAYIEVTPDDVALANRLANEVLGRSLDELAPQTRRLLMSLDVMVKESCERDQMVRSDFRFTRREVRTYTGWTANQLQVHLNRLVDLEYLLVHRGGRGQQVVYELCYEGEGKNGEPFLSGLINVEALKGESTTESSLGSLGEFLGSSLPQLGAILGPSWSALSDEKAVSDGGIQETDSESSQNARSGSTSAATSYTQARRTLVAASGSR